MDGESLRILRIREVLRERELDAALIFSPPNRRYLCGFAGSTGYVVITETHCSFLVDFRYQEQAKDQCPGWELVKITGEPDVFSWLKEQGLQRLGVEHDFMTLRFSSLLAEKGQVSVTEDISDVLLELRMVKDEEELRRIRGACEITDLAFEHVLTRIGEGMTEVEIDSMLQSFMRAYPEVERMADRFIVASGEHGALPHGIAGERRVRRGEFITMDFGCCFQGYWSDVTRTVCLGRAGERQREIYQVTLEAQEEAIRAISPGKTGREIDRIARNVIRKTGYGEYFGHGLGHSFGLEIHESPRFAQNEAGDIPLKPGMILTVEPGIYIPGFGGVRIEDDIIITEDGCIDLTKAPKQLIEI
ncbi:aminopeptidase P family protein [bacterium 1XD21-13]|nr:aminopeptidase P family protein [bacterium 1XD21-13]